MSELPILSVITFLPLVGALVLLLMPKGAVGAIRSWTLGVAVVNFVVSLPHGSTAAKTNPQEISYHYQLAG